MARKPSARLSQNDRSEETRRKILVAATKLFARDGFERTSTENIAKEAGVSQGIIFHYFSTKKNLFWVIVLGELENQEEIEQSNRELALETDPAQKLRLFAKQMVRRAEKYPELNEIRVRHLFSVAFEIDPEEAQRIWKRGQILEQIFVEGKEKGVFRPDLNSRAALAAFTGAFNMNYLVWNMMGRKENLPDLVAQATEYLLCGMTRKE